MNSELFSRNLRRLRQGKNLTQEQLANIIGVSVQSVSRWECGNTLPDVMLLPELARLYGVTVDDLYREDVRGYTNYAQRLVSVYEASGRSEDFLAAEQAYSAMKEEELTADDLRCWGVLYHYMMKRCSRLALGKLEEAMAHKEVAEQVYCSAALQKNAVLCDLGRGREEAERYGRLLAEKPEDPKLWILASAVELLTGAYEQALGHALEGIRRFPERAVLYAHAGDALQGLKRYEEAFSYWDKAIALDKTFLDAAFSKAFCHEELGQWQLARQDWLWITRELDSRGYSIEREFPARRAERCLEKTNGV